MTLEEAIVRRNEAFEWIEGHMGNEELESIWKRSPVVLLLNDLIQDLRERDVKLQGKHKEAVDLLRRTKEASGAWIDCIDWECDGSYQSPEMESLLAEIGDFIPVHIPQDTPGERYREPFTDIPENMNVIIGKPNIKSDKAADLSDYLESLKAHGIEIEDNRKIGMGFWVKSQPFKYACLGFDKKDSFYCRTVGTYCSLDQSRAYAAELLAVAEIIETLNGLMQQESHYNANERKARSSHLPNTRAFTPEEQKTWDEMGNELEGLCKKFDESRRCIWHPRNDSNVENTEDEK